MLNVLRFPYRKPAYGSMATMTCGCSCILHILSYVYAYLTGICHGEITIQDFIQNYKILYSWVLDLFI